MNNNCQGYDFSMESLHCNKAFNFSSKSATDEINEVRIEWSVERCRNKRRTDKTRTKLTETTLITPISIHTIRQNIETRCNRAYISFEAIVLKLIVRRYCITLPAGFHQVT